MYSIKFNKLKICYLELKTETNRRGPRNWLKTDLQIISFVRTSIYFENKISSLLIYVYDIRLYSLTLHITYTFKKHCIHPVSITIIIIPVTFVDLYNEILDFSLHFVHWLNDNMLTKLITRKRAIFSSCKNIICRRHTHYVLCH